MQDLTPLIEQSLAAIYVFQYLNHAPHLAGWRSYYQARVDSSKIAKLLSCRFCLSFWCGLTVAVLNVVACCVGGYTEIVWTWLLRTMAIISLVEISSFIMESISARE